MRRLFASFGYREIQTPTFEHLELFTAKSGESIIDELYSFQDKGGRDLALRPELTAPVIRCYIEKLQMEPKPLKLFYIGNCYRYDRPQKGRYREFQQAGCELIGASTVEASTELIAMAYTIIHNVGVKNIGLHIGDLTLLAALFDHYKITPEQRKPLIPLIDKAQYTELSTALHDQGLPAKDIEELLDLLQTSDLKKIKPFIKGNRSAETEYLFIEQLFTLLHASFNITNAHLKLGIVRGLDYYKGFVFEIEAPVLGAEKQLCGGGAYELVNIFGGSEVPQAGFAIGFDRTILALESEHFTFPVSFVDAYVIPVNEDMIPIALQIATTLRDHDTTIDVDLLRRGIGKALKYADTLHAKHAIIVGPKEHQENAVTLRDLQTGAQLQVKTTDLFTHLKQS